MVAEITIPGMFLTGDHASRPAATAVGGGSLYACSTHTKVYQSDGSSWSDWFDPTALGGGGGLVGYDIEIESGGDITIDDTAVGSFADINAVVGDLVVAASTGDLLTVSLSAFSGSAANSLKLDVKCITGSTENFLSSGGTTADTNGIAAWFCHASTNQNIGSSYDYVVQAADISGGNVTLRLCGWVSGGSRVLSAATTARLRFSVKNFGQ